MSRVEFSESQKSVIEKRNANLLVSAAAGSGKTEVLAERIAELVTDKDHPIGIDHMVVLTFTEAAAAEMRERVTGKLAERLNENPGDERLYAQSMLVQNALITTIDSFCLYIIRNSFSEIGIDPGFRVLDSGEKTLLLKDTYDQVLEESLENEETREGTLKILDNLTDNQKTLEETVMAFATFLYAMPDPDKWIENALLCYRAETLEDLYKTDLFKFVLEDAKGIAADGKKTADAALAYIKDNEADIPDGDKKTMETVGEQIGLIANAPDLNCLIKNAFTYKVPAMGRTAYEGKQVLSDYKGAVKGFVDTIKKILSFNPEMIISDGHKMADVIDALVDFTKRFMKKFDEVKRDKNVIDFVDMERMALDILSDSDNRELPSGTALEYRDYFDVIMVDEYQDSNALQESILTKICREDNYFMVGDVKQSIYRFRGACPDIFTDKYNTFKSEGKNIRIDLNMNYRSRSSVLDFANMIFGNIMNRFTCGGLDYDDAAKLYYGAKNYDVNDDSKAEILFLTDDAEDEKLSGEEKYDFEGLLIANRIKQLFDEGFMVTEKKDGTRRKIRYSDIVILLRVEKDINDRIKKVLEQQGVPAYAAEKRGFFQTVEVRTLLSYLIVLDNPRIDNDFYGVLTGMLGGFTPSECVTMRAGHKEGYSLYDDFLKCDAPELKDKKDRLIDNLRRHGKMAKYMSLRELLETIIDETGYLTHMSALPAGEKRKANILALLEKATDFENTSYHGLFQFNRYIDSLKAREVDEGEAGTISEGDDVVRIMSMHKSKGLEFPVVFVSGLGKTYNDSGWKKSFLYDREYGIGVDIIDPVKRTRKPDIRKTAVASVIKRADRAESMRILYVALTRAREKLIVTGCDGLDTIEKMPEKGMLLNSDINGYTSLIKLVLAAVYNSGLSEEMVRVYTPAELALNDADNDIMSVKRLDDIKTVTDSGEGPDEEIKAKLDKMINPVYPGERLKGLYTKTSVSAIKKRYMEENEGIVKKFEAAEDEGAAAGTYHAEPVINEDIPVFARGEDYAAPVGKGALSGSATHRIMELISFTDIAGLGDRERVAYIKGLIKTTSESGLLEKGFDELIDREKCSRFFDSSLGKRMCEADRNGLLKKEKSFFLAKKASDVEDGFPDDEDIIVQGIIDAYFIENGEIVLMDYKTDRVGSGKELADMYKAQLDLYTEALERITGLKVSERIIYSFCLGEEIQL